MEENYSVRLRFRRRRVLWSLLAVVFVGIPLLVWALGGPPERLVTVLTVHMVGGTLAFGLCVVFYKCPRCGTPLGREVAGRWGKKKRIKDSLRIAMKPRACSECGLKEP